MSNTKYVLIGIQARSGSKRLPGKVHEMLGEKTVIEHVIHNCKSSAHYVNRFSHTNRCMASVCLLVPHDDPLIDRCKRFVSIVEGPEDDVLSRYVKAMKHQGADYIVRVTGDCPLIPPFLITKHIKIAIQNGYDYLSNVDVNARTSIDGLDCEVMSRQMLDWLDENAKDASDREHVTTLARKSPPDWAKIGFVLSTIDLSHIKLSIDNDQDLEHVRTQMERVQKAVEYAESIAGKEHVHRL